MCIVLLFCPAAASQRRMDAYPEVVPAIPIPSKKNSEVPSRSLCTLHARPQRLTPPPPSYSPPCPQGPDCVCSPPDQHTTPQLIGPPTATGELTHPSDRLFHACWLTPPPLLPRQRGRAAPFGGLSRVQGARRGPPPRSRQGSRSASRRMTGRRAVSLGTSSSTALGVLCARILATNPNPHLNHTNCQNQGEA